MSDTIEYIEITNSALGTVDGAGDTLVIGEYNPCIPNINPPYVAENTANKRCNLINPNNITYPTTLAVASAISGITTDYTFIQSGITVITQTGRNVNIYVSPNSATGVTWNSITDKPDLVLTSTFSGYTGQTLQLINTKLFISTFSGYTGQTLITLNGKTATGTTAQLRQNFNQHSGNTSIHQTSGNTQSLINSNLTNYYDKQDVNALISGFTTGNTFTQSGATIITHVGDNINIWTPPPTSLVGYWTSGQTKLYVSGVTSGLTADWNSLANRPNWLTGTTLQAFETGHTHSQYITNLNGYWTSGQTKTAINIATSGFTTGNTFTQSGATIITQIDDNINIWTPVINLTPYTLLSTFSGYTGTTQQAIADRLLISTFSGYTGSTNSRLNILEAIDTIVITGATNGLCKYDNNNVCLGGSLTSNVDINGGYTQNLSFSCLNQFNLSFDNISTITDCSTNGGLRYAGDYSLNYVNTSIPDKKYVDTVATGVQIHAAANVATTTPIILTGQTQIIDNITISHGMRILVKNQLSGSTNGIYSASTGTWNRTLDYNFAPSGEISNGDIIPVISGSTQANTLWALTTPNPIVSGNTLNFTLFSQLIDVTAGQGIAISTIGGAHNVCVLLGTNSGTGCGLAVTNNGLCIDSNIAGCALTYSAGVLCVNAASCGSVPSIPVGFNTAECLVVATSDIRTAVCAVTGATNLGSGNGSIFTNVSNNKINLKSLSGGTNTTLNCNSNYIAINTTNIWTSGQTENAISIATSGFTTGNTFTQSGATILKKVGNNLTIYTPVISLTPYTLLSTFSGYTGTTQQAIADRLLISTFSGYTGTTQQAIADRLLISTFSGYTGTTQQAIADRLLISTFSGYTGTTIPNTYATKVLAITGATSMSGTSIIHTTSVATNKIQLKGIEVTGNLKLINGTNALTLSGGTAGASAPIFKTVTLTVAGWTGATKQQKVYVTDVTTTNNIIVSPPSTRTEFLAYGTAVINCIAQGNGWLTFEASTVPVIQLIANIEIIT